MSRKREVFAYTASGGTYPECLRLFETTTEGVYELEVHDGAVVRHCEDGAHFVDGPIASCFIHKDSLAMLAFAILGEFPSEPPQSGREKATLAEAFDVVGEQPEEQS